MFSIEKTEQESKIFRSGKVNIIKFKDQEIGNYAIKMELILDSEDYKINIKLYCVKSKKEEIFKEYANLNPEYEETDEYIIVKLRE